MAISPLVSATYTILNEVRLSILTYYVPQECALTTLHTPQLNAYWCFHFLVTQI